MTKMISVILSSVLMLEICGAAYEIKPAEANKLPLSDHTPIMNAEKLIYQNPFNPRLGTRTESNSEGQKSRVRNDTPYNNKGSMGPAIMPYYDKNPIEADLLNS